MARRQGGIVFVTRTFYSDGMRPVSEATARITGESFSKKYIALGRIVSHWGDIVGKDMAGKAQPARLLYRGRKGGGGTPDATLEIATTSAHATALHYQKDLILERINRVFGERWITAIRFVAEASNAKDVRIKRPPAPLSPQDRGELDVVLQGIGDEEIKMRLEKLGEAVIREGNRTE